MKYLVAILVLVLMISGAAMAQNWNGLPIYGSGAGDARTVTVTASVPRFINLDSIDTTISFGNLAPEASGNFECSDYAEAVITTNVELCALYNNGSNLSNSITTLPTTFRSRLWGRFAFPDTNGGQYITTEATWGGIGEAFDTQLVRIDKGQTATCRTYATITRDGYNDTPGTYTQSTPLTITFWAKY